jgi:hypothetical protein
MKTVFFLMALILLSGFAPQDSDGFQLTLPIVLAMLAAIYEALSRIIPTSRMWSIVGKLLELLTWLSSKLDRKKK